VPPAGDEAADDGLAVPPPPHAANTTDNITTSASGRINLPIKTIPPIRSAPHVLHVVVMNVTGAGYPSFIVVLSAR
jgi:hypothetical protein